MFLNPKRKGGRSMKKWKFKEYVEYIIELSELLENGYSLQDTLEIGVKMHIGRRRETYAILVDFCNKGELLSEALFYLQFPKWMISLLKVSEEKGEIENGLRQIANMGENILLIQKYIMKQFRYPLFLFFSLLAFLLFFQFVFYPQLSIQMQSLGFAYPQYVSITINLLLFIPYSFSLTLFIVCMIAFMFMKQYKTYGILWEMLERRGRHIKRFVAKIATYFFALYLGELLKGGVSLLASLVFIRQTMLQSLLSKDLQMMIKGLEDGYPFYNLISRAIWVDSSIVWSVQYGEIRGEVSNELLRYTKRFIDVEKRKIERKVRVITASIFIYIAVCVVLLYALIFFPIYQGMSQML